MLMKKQKGDFNFSFNFPILFQISHKKKRERERPCFLLNMQNREKGREKKENEELDEGGF